MIEQFHFLRPAWLLALLPLAGWLWWHFQQRHNSRHWQSVVDAELLPHLLDGEENVRHHHLSLLLSICCLLAIIALAGPVWQKQPQATFNQQSALVIALDLSRSMNVGDIKPNRLTRARHKIDDILSQRKTGQTALVGYAADAFIVTPLTDDTDTIAALLPSLSTDIMPAQGSRADQALQQALTLLENARVPKGDVLLVSDGFSQREISAIQTLLADNTQLRVSVLGIGTAEGGPIPLASGGFFKDTQGSIVIPRLNEKDMRLVAKLGDGRFQSISPTDTDIKALLETINLNRFDGGAEASDLNTELWREQGPWLLLIIIPLVALLFRRGVILSLPLLLPLPPEAQAIGWDELWQNADQRAKQAFQQNQHQAASELFENPAWKASSLYRIEDYEQALQHWQNIDSADAHYNRGNALARLGRLEEAISAYNQALQKRPGDEDAIFNKQQVEALLKQQQQSGQNQPGSDQARQDQQQQGQQAQNRQIQDQQEKNRQDQQNQSPQPDDEVTEKQQPAEAKQTQSQDDGQQSLEQQMSEQAEAQWLRKIPDDPGGLLRRKFRHQYQQRNSNSNSNETQPW